MYVYLCICVYLANRIFLFAVGKSIYAAPVDQSIQVRKHLLII